MPNYRRAIVPGGTFFFTVVTYNRKRIFQDELACQVLYDSIDLVRKEHPFEMIAFVLLYDHLHCIWELPENDYNYSIRWKKIKTLFTKKWKKVDGLKYQLPQSKKGECGFWQRRFWEHTIRDNDDLIRHLDYIHYNPLKHEYVQCVHEWKNSSFHKYMKDGVYDKEWCCSCDGSKVKAPYALQTKHECYYE